MSPFRVAAGLRARSRGHRSPEPGARRTLGLAPAGSNDEQWSACAVPVPRHHDFHGSGVVGDHPSSCASRNGSCSGSGPPVHPCRGRGARSSPHRARPRPLSWSCASAAHPGPSTTCRWRRPGALAPGLCPAPPASAAVAAPVVRRIVVGSHPPVSPCSRSSRPSRPTGRSGHSPLSRLSLPMRVDRLEPSAWPQGNAWAGKGSRLSHGASRTVTSVIVIVSGPPQPHGVRSGR